MEGYVADPLSHSNSFSDLITLTNTPWWIVTPSPQATLLRRLLDPCSQRSIAAYRAFLDSPYVCGVSNSRAILLMLTIELVCWARFLSHGVWHSPNNPSFPDCDCDTGWSQIWTSFGRCVVCSEGYIGEECQYRYYCWTAALRRTLSSLGGYVSLA